MIKMDTYTGFCDLCIPFNSSEEKLSKTLDEVHRLGYKIVAIEQIFDEKSNNITGNARHGNDQFPVPIFLETFEKYKNKLKILSRLTIVYSDTGITHRMTTSTNLKKFNIIAGRPTTENALNNCCSVFPCDLISLSAEESELFINRKNYSIATRRGLYFEIQYAPAIIDTNYRKKTIVRSHKFHVTGKSKNVILTSGATNSLYLRSPYDIANLGLIFGLSEEQSKHSMLGLCRDMLIRAEARRHGKTIIYLKERTVEVEMGNSEDDESDMELDFVPLKKQRFD